ncbi:MAG: FAD:protein FMN transferase [Vicinamibacterales bacterium]|nr:FAD:protein FMN transferase [Vicinamibacterales bacterium]
MPIPPAIHAIARSAAFAASLGAAFACATPPPAPPPVACIDLSPREAPDRPHHLWAERPFMGTTFQIRVITADAAHGCAAVNAAFQEVARQESLFSEYRDSSDISAINRAAGQSPVSVDPEVFILLQRSLWASQATAGAFDITFAGCGRLWSVREHRIPDDRALAACLDTVGYRTLVLDPWRSSAWLPTAGMRIGLGGMAKGYGVDRAADVLRARGLTRFAVDGGGDLRVQGTDIDGAWTVQIAHPRNPGHVFETIRLDRGAIVTSGDYLRFFERNGVRYHHILDPATGQPARRSVAVTVMAPNATDADALATGLFVLGPERGLAALARLPGVEALFFDHNLNVSASRGFPRAAGARTTPSS